MWGFINFLLDYFLLFVLFIGIWFYHSRQKKKEFKELKDHVIWLSNKLKDLDAEFSHFKMNLQGTPSTPEQKSPSIIETASPKEEIKPAYSEDESKKTEDRFEEPKKQAQSIGATENLAAKLTRASNFENMETDLSTRWMIWVGGIAFALGGAFFVKYSIDAGLLSPAVRVSLGTIFGVVLSISGELFRRHRANVTWLKGTPDYLPVAISAAGFFTAFAAVYSAFALYQLIPALLAFIGLTLLAFGAMGLALFQGRFFAYLGMIGGLFIPMLISTGSGNAWALFPYLLLIVGSSLWVARKQAWIDIAATTLVLAILWVYVWIGANWHVGDIAPVGLYLLILSGLNTATLRGASSARKTGPNLSDLFPQHIVTWMSDIVNILVVVFLVSIVRLDNYSSLGFMLISAGLIGQSYAVYRSAENDMGGLISIFGVLFLIGTWHVPDLVEMNDLAFGDTSKNFVWSPIAPPGLQTFITTCLLYGGIIGAFIFAFIPKLLRKGFWSSMGNIVPLTILILAYGRINDLETSLPFATVAAALALVMTYATITLNKKTNLIGMVPVAAYASGATLAIALALTMVMRDAWLSFALTMEIVALAYIWQKTKVDGLRTLALLLATIVLVRLFFNDQIFGYHGAGAMPWFNWLFYGYGLTAGLFHLAGKLFDDGRENGRLISVLKAGSILLFVSFITLEIRVLFSDGNNLSSVPSDLEMALQTINWGVATTLLMWREIKDGDKLFGLLRRFMTVVTLIGLVIGGGFMNNIFFTTVDVGALVVFNLQFLQYFIPASLYGVKAYMARGAGKARSVKLYGGVAFFTTWFWLSAEVRHTFFPNGRFVFTRDPNFDQGAYNQLLDWERYGYSLIWLLFAAALLFLGLRKNVKQIRMAGLGVLSVVVLKVFLIDMSSLEGLARAVSFMGLGAGLIGIGYLYQRVNAVEKAERVEG